MYYYLIALQQLIASGTHIVAKSLTSEMPATVVLLLRVSIVSLFYGAWLWIQSKKIKKIERTDYLSLLILSAVNIPINQFLFLKSMEYTEAANVALAYSLTPAFVYIIAVIFMGEAFNKLKTAGISLAIVGTIIVISEKKFSFNSEGMIGDLLALMASFSWAIYTIMGKKFSLKYGAIYSTSLTMFIGLIMYTPIFLITGSQIDFSTISPKNWAQLLYLGILTSGVGYAIWYYALTKTDASKVAVFNNLQPALTSALAFFILGSTVSIYFIVGGICVIIGVFMTQRG